MTREAFIEVLDEKGYSYRAEGNKVIVTHKGSVNLRDLTSLPPGVVFKSEAGVNLNSLTSLSPDVDFKNWTHVYLKSLTSLPPEVEFRNGGSVYLGSVMGWFYQWEGNIEGINKNRLLNFMISKGLFER
jgi:hypothetical protein